jgi:hypothetical protein
MLRDGTVLESRDALPGTRGLGHLYLSQPRFLAHLDQMLGSDLERSPLTSLLHGRTVIGMDELIPGTHRACR